MPYEGFDSVASSLIRGATVRIRAEMRAAAPAMARHAWAWMRSLSGGGHPYRYFTARWDYPVVLLPYWLDRCVAAGRDRSFRTDMVYSTVNGYYFLRLCDNLMDDETTVERSLLPAATFFHSEFQASYHRFFPNGHPFWRVFRKNWFGSAEAAFRDIRQEGFSLAQFRRIAARKTCAAKIPIAAVCHRYGRQDLLPLWSTFSDRLACFIQMTDDLFDWRQDAARGEGSTYFLSEADRRRQPGETSNVWILRSGFRWGLDLCLDWLADLRARARRLCCPPLEALLASRQAILIDQGNRTAAALHAFLPVASVLSHTSHVADCRSSTAVPSDQHAHQTQATQ